MSDARPTWFRIGHVTYGEERTGCTVVVFNEAAPAVVDVRGGSPGTRETDLLRAGSLVGRADAILLTGGSAFGLAAADGVVRYLAERGRGFASAAGPVPIVPGAVIFDLANGTAHHPAADDGYAAAERATSAPWDTGRVGAGTGATVAKLGARGAPTPAGLGIATQRAGTYDVTAIVVLNAVGDVREPDSGRWLARSVDPSGSGRTGREIVIESADGPRPGENTSLGIVLVSTPLDRDALTRCCIAAHAALARCVVPAHTIFDGDTFFAVCPAAGQTTPVQVLALQAAVELAVERAIVSVFRPQD
jgi:L-aminopeptidase/D-esterase-like protein